MNRTQYDELVFSQDDICDLLMQGRDINGLKNLVVDADVNLGKLINDVELPESLLSWRVSTTDMTIDQFHQAQQHVWHMPDEYQQMDIAAYVLGLCNSEAELQRVGEELLLYQERDLFNLLKYLKYLVDVMIANRVIWGVGRGSSVASFVLYKLKVHRIDSMYYNLNINEFLR